MDEASDLLKERYKKYEAVKALGLDPFGGRFDKQAPVARLVEHFSEGQQVKTAGRLTATRFMGKTVFADLKDETGRIQLFIKPSELSEQHQQIFNCLDIGDILGIAGEMFKTKTGEISIRVKELTLLSKSLRPMPEKWHGLKDVETRYRQRYLDLIANDTTKEIFTKRSKIVRSVRAVLDNKDYLEVETPMMHPIPGGAAGKPFKTHHEALGLDLYLRVAPELYLKRLLVGGFDKVYEINKSFRNEGISTRHNPEFTMLEVYTAYHDVEDVMALCEEILQNAAKSVGADFLKVERVSFAGLMKEAFGITPEEDSESWIKKLKAKGHDIHGKDISRTQIINIVGELLEERIKGSGAVFVTEYFAEISPLARRNKKNPHLADRFELYIGGMEVANGYSEQNDPIEQKQRFLEELAEKGNEKGKLDEDYIYALEHGMPPAGGLGIGIDRLVMILTTQPTIREVILFPQMRGQ